MDQAVIACLPWAGARNRQGYGRTGTGKLAHRAAWEAAHGPVPEGLCVLHHCDNPPCVNPEHLYVGTRADNARDSLLRGRKLCGERSPAAKLSASDVSEIRRRAESGERVVLLAREFGIHWRHVYRIVARERWAW